MSERRVRGEWIIVWLIAAACLLALGWYVGEIRATKKFAVQIKAAVEQATERLTMQFTGKMPAGKQPKVRVKPVAEEVVNPPREFIGHAEALESVEVKARVAGYLTEVAFEEGAVVKAGDLLFAIDEEDYAARVAQRRAEIVRSEAMVERAGSVQERAENVLKRLEAADERSVSALDLDNARADVSTAKADVSTAKAALAEAQTLLLSAEIDLKHTKVYAPITGKIGRRAVSKGDYIVPAAALVRVVQLDPIRVLFSVTDRDFVEFKTRADVRGDSDKIRARIVLPTGAEYPHPGMWDFFDNSMALNTPSLAVWLLLENKEGVLLPNTYVNVLVEGSALTPVPVVDLSAVVQNVQGAYVYTVNASNTVEMARVKLGLKTEKVAAVESGLSVGDRVVVEGMQNVRPGVAVEVLNQ